LGNANTDDTVTFKSYNMKSMKKYFIIVFWKALEVLKYTIKNEERSV